MKFLKFTFSFLMAAVVFAAAISVYGQKKKRPRKPTRPAQAVRSITGTISPSDEAALRRDIAMATAWSIVNKTYYDATFGGQDWEKIGTEFALRAQKAKTDDEVDDLIREMVGRLNKSHFGVLSGSFYRSIEAARKTLAAKEGRKVEPSDADAATDGGEGSLDLFNDDSNRKYGVGIDLRKIDGRLVIVSVAAGSSAAEAGVRPGFILDAINGVPLSEITASIAKAAPNVRHLERMLPLVIKSWILDRDYSLNVKVRCLDGNDTPKEFDLERRPLNGEIISFANGFPKQMFEYESRPLSDEIGYIRFNMFSYQLLGKFCDSLAAFKGKKALILDLRGNIGGLLPAMRGLAGMLEPKGTSLGTLSSRGESLDLLTDDKVKKFKGKLVILIDDQSRSASELFSAALQDKGRAVVIGVPTPGEALPSSTVRLETGSIMQFPIANFLRPSGTEIEGIGVTPDIEVRPDREQLLTGADKALERAAALINSAEFDALLKVREKLPATVSRIEKPEGAAPPPAVKAHTGDDNTAPPPAVETYTVDDKIKRGDPKEKTFTGDVVAPPPIFIPKKAKPEALVVQPAALAIVKKAAARIGDLSTIKTYTLNGSMIVRTATARVDYKYSFFRELPNKYSYSLVSDAVGTAHAGAIGSETFFDGNVSLMGKTVVKGDDPRVDFYQPLIEVLSPGYFVSLSTSGVYTEDGEQKVFVKGENAAGEEVLLTFNAKTGLPMKAVLNGFDVRFSNYKTEGQVTLPLSVEYKGAANILLLIDSISLNVPIDPAAFVKKESCFDKP